MLCEDIGLEVQQPFCSQENHRHTDQRWALWSHQMDSEASQPPLKFFNNKCPYDLKKINKINKK